MNKTQKLKEIAKEIDVIPYWNKNPNSTSLSRIIKHQKGVLESENEEETVKSAERLKHYLWILVNKTQHIIKEEKEKLNNIISKLDEYSKY
jgi:hypothetical protein